MIDNQFHRTQLLLGEEKLEKLKNIKVTIVGIGAVGGFALEALVRSGIQNLRIIDFDTIEKSNINRQINALHSNIGDKKIKEAKRRALDINPNCNIEALDLFVNNETIDEALNNNPDYVIDAIDSLNPKVTLIEACVKREIKIFSSMGAALKTDPTKIEISDISKTYNCTLAKIVRKRLHRRDIKTGFTCVFSSEKSFQRSFDNNGNYNNKEELSRNTLGSLTTIPAIFGLILANCIITDKNI